MLVWQWWITEELSFRIRHSSSTYLPCVALEFLYGKSVCSTAVYLVPSSDIYVSTTCLIYYSSHDEGDGRLVVRCIASVSSHLPLPPLSTAVGIERVTAVISIYQCGLTTKLFVPATSYERATLGANDVAKSSKALSSSATPMSACIVSRMWGFMEAECCAVWLPDVLVRRR